MARLERPQLAAGQDTGVATPDPQGVMSRVPI